MTAMAAKSRYSTIQTQKRFVRTLIDKFLFWADLFGVDIRSLIRSITAIPRYISNLQKLKGQITHFKTDKKITSLYPCLRDYSQPSGNTRGHYFHQDLHVAQLIFQHSPARHIDVGSRIDGFVAHVATFRKIEVLDIRPTTDEIKNITFHQSDITKLQSNLLESCDSLSCLHALEHIGLGRYGDDIDINGYLIAWDHLHKMLQTGGTLYFSVPIGPSRIEFDAHRVFAIEELLKMIRPRYEIINFAFVDDSGKFHPNHEGLLESELGYQNFQCKYGCGIFQLQKK